jgi:hypothetical protein
METPRGGTCSCINHYLSDPFLDENKRLCETSEALESAEIITLLFSVSVVVLHIKMISTQ